MDSKATDEELLSSFLRGNRSALGELARRYEPLLVGLAAGLLGGSSSMACDAVQDSWIRVIRHGHTFNGHSSVKTWLYRIAINRCRDLGRRKVFAESGQTAERIGAPEDGPEGSLMIRERNHALHEAIGRLSRKKREVLLLCYHEGVTHEQAAEILEIPVGTLKSRLHGALEQLRQRLSDKAMT